MKDISCRISRSVAVLNENAKGYTKEVNFVSWNSNEPKLDIREWHPGHERCGKGVTLTIAESKKLYEALKDLFRNQ